MRNIEIRAPFNVGNGLTDSLDISRLDGSFLPQFADPFTRIHASGPPTLLFDAFLYVANRERVNCISGFRRHWPITKCSEPCFRAKLPKCEKLETL